MRIKREKLDEDSGTIADIPTPRSLGNQFGTHCDNLQFRGRKFRTVILSRLDTECHVWNMRTVTILRPLQLNTTILKK